MQGTQSGDPNRLRSAALGDRPVGVGLENSTREVRPAMQHEVVHQREVSSFIASYIISVLCESGQESVPGLSHVLHIAGTTTYQIYAVAGGRPRMFLCSKDVTVAWVASPGTER